MFWQSFTPNVTKGTGLFLRVVLKKERRKNILDNSSNKKIPPLTKEQIWRLYQLSKMPDEEIDYSDIPEITDEE